MKQGVVIAICTLAAAAMVPSGAAADPGTAGAPRAAFAADTVFAPANRWLFAQCTAGRDAAAQIATNRDAAALAAADRTFAGCMRSAINPDGVAAAELGIAATAFLTAQTSSGAARLAAFARAADYAERADERWRSFHGVVLSSGVTAVPHAETRQGSDNPNERVEVGLPGGPAAGNGFFDYGRVPDYRPPSELPPTPFDVLALNLEDQARALRAATVVTR